MKGWGAGRGLDGEGRIGQVTAATGQNPVTSVSYNSASLPTQVNFGSGDSDIFAYDPSTLRMAQFKFNVGTLSQSLTGNLTWNANATLGQLAITDQFNSTNTQTCNYAHDDLIRIASANCGSAAAQTFTYDPFGNINKSGSPYSFLPTYSTATNRMTSLSGFTPTYDANGNVTNDNSHIYSWDSDGNSIVLDSVGLTFDALDRMVEQNRSGSYTEIVYAPTEDKLALMNGQTLQKAFVPLPGQATAVYTNSGLDHYRHSDWLGSARLTSTPSRTVSSTVAYAPFGESYAQSGTADLSFTGQNQDTTSGDYDFLYREYSMQGRWPSPDPAGLSAVDPTFPQSWNRYVYVLNNPLAAVDPVGLWCVWQDGTHDDNPQDGGIDELGCLIQGGLWDQTNTLTGCNSSWNCTMGNGSTISGCSDAEESCVWQPGDTITVNGNSSNENTTNDPCANATLSAAGVNIRQNIAQAQTTISQGRMMGITGGSYNYTTGSLAALFNYAMLVGTGRPQDVKNQPGPGTPQQKIDAGNISFGVTCSFGEAFCQFAAGLAQTLAGNPNFQGTLKTGFDTPSDNAAIRVGQAMRAAGCHE